METITPKHTNYYSKHINQSIVYKTTNKMYIILVQIPYFEQFKRHVSSTTYDTPVRKCFSGGGCELFMCRSIRTYAFKTLISRNTIVPHGLLYQTSVCAEDGYLVSEYYLLGFINGSQNVSCFYNIMVCYCCSRCCCCTVATGLYFVVLLFVSRISH